MHSNNLYYNLKIKKKNIEGCRIVLLTDNKKKLLLLSPAFMYHDFLTAWPLLV